MDGVVTRFYRFRISSNRRNGRNLCGVFWPESSLPTGPLITPNQNTTDNSNAADTKQRNVGEFFPDKKS